MISLITIIHQMSKNPRHDQIAIKTLLRFYKYEGKDI